MIVANEITGQTDEITKPWNQYAWSWIIISMCSLWSKVLLLFLVLILECICHPGLFNKASHGLVVAQISVSNTHSFRRDRVMEGSCRARPPAAPLLNAVSPPGLSDGWVRRRWSEWSTGTPAAVCPSAVWRGRWTPGAPAGPGSPSSLWRPPSVCTGDGSGCPETPVGSGEKEESQSCSLVTQNQS